MGPGLQELPRRVISTSSPEGEIFRKTNQYMQKYSSERVPALEGKKINVVRAQRPRGTWARTRYKEV